MAMADLCGHFGVASSTGGNKAKIVRQALGMHQLDHRWTLPSQMAANPALWMVSVNGLFADARHLPAELQEMAVRKGLIPFVWEQPE